MNLSEIRGRLSKATPGPYLASEQALEHPAGSAYIVRFREEPITYTAQILTPAVVRPLGQTSCAFVASETKDQLHADADFIAHSWQDISDLLALVDEAGELAESLPGGTAELDDSGAWCYVADWENYAERCRKFRAKLEDKS